ncbi:hypothetical protein L1049_008221 [Liquidambar formosana]|uniref:Uncharacterized protein n=1 Tax=Liquidambar formosana TaxID=63359 RepID=A0AAP0S925_LIQFO
MGIGICCSWGFQLQRPVDVDGVTRGAIFIQRLRSKTHIAAFNAEAQEATIRDASNLCDVAEAICNAQEEHLKNSFIDLPIWASLRELMASLCDDE